MGAIAKCLLYFSVRLLSYHYLTESLQETGQVNINPILQVRKLKVREGNLPIGTYLEDFLFAFLPEVYSYETLTILFKSFW